MLGTFIKGLKHDIRSAVRILQPNGLPPTIRLAIMVDEDRLDGVIGEPKG